MSLSAAKFERALGAGARRGLAACRSGDPGSVLPSGTLRLGRHGSVWALAAPGYDQCATATSHSFFWCASSELERERLLFPLHSARASEGLRSPVPVVEPGPAVSCAAPGATVPVSRVPIVSVPVVAVVVPVAPADHCRKKLADMLNPMVLSSRLVCSSLVKFYQTKRM